MFYFSCAFPKQCRLTSQCFVSVCDQYGQRVCTLSGRVCKITAFAEAPNPFPNISSQTEGDSARK